MDNQFFSTFGIEFSYLAPIPRRRGEHWSEQTDYDRASGYVHLVRAAFQAHDIDFFKIDNDEGAIEIVTQPMRNLDQAKHFWGFMNAITTELGLTTHRDDTYSGGGHIHWGLGHLDVKQRCAFMVALYRDVTNRPYLNWMFNEYCDINSAESLVFSQKGSSCREMVFNNKAAREAIEKLSWWKLRGHKGFCVRSEGDSNTVEFRFLDAKPTWQVTQDHIQFCDAYLRYIQKVAEKNPIVKVKVKTAKDILAMVPTAVTDFKKFIELLGLNWKTYRKYVKMNFLPRCDQGDFVTDDQYSNYSGVLSQVELERIGTQVREQTHMLVQRQAIFGTAITPEDIDRAVDAIRNQNGIAAPPVRRSAHLDAESAESIALPTWVHADARPKKRRRHHVKPQQKLTRRHHRHVS
jgi:hypothetical protein